MGYKTEDGAANTFDLDIVYVLPTAWKTLPSPIEPGLKIRGATLENIILDEIATCHRFGAGNTRMKDFDDLWRIAQANQKINWPSVKKGLQARGVPILLKQEWINEETSQAWERHVKKYKDLPAKLDELLAELNSWLERGLAP